LLIKYQLTDIKEYDMRFPVNPFNSRDESNIRFNETVFRNKLSNQSSSEMKKLFNFMSNATGNIF
jgi:hypothetical protein